MCTGSRCVRSGPSGSSGSSGGRWVHYGSSGSFQYAIAVVGLDCVRVVHQGGAVEFVRVRLVRPGVPWRSMGWFGFVWFVRVRPGGRRVHSGCSVFTLGVAGFVRVLLVCPSAPMGSLRSFWFVWLVRGSPGGRWIR